MAEPRVATTGPGEGASGATPGVTRRDALRGLAASAALPCVGAPGILKRRRPVLRVLGTHVTLQEQLRIQAERDLGISLEFHPGGTAAVLQRASTRPESFDVFEQWSNTLPLLWQADAIRPLDVDRIERWDEINSLTKTGRLVPGAPLGRGDAPCKLLYVQRDGSLGPTASEQVSFLPYVHNVDSFGYTLRSVPEGTPYETESWGWLLDERWSGKVALVNEPTIGLFDAALAARAQGLVEIADVGAMTREELDALFDLLVRKKREGHFYGAWNSVPQSVEYMDSGRVVVESLFSPGIASLRMAGHDVVYAAPREGYRAWHGVMCLSSAASAEIEESAYRYMNWWLSGWAGALMARQGYYISVPDPAREHLTRAEWDYWYEGQPAREDLPGPGGRTAVEQGARRRGGSYTERFSRIAVWNTVMDTYEYSLLKWYEFLTA